MIDNYVGLRRLLRQLIWLPLLLVQLGPASATVVYDNTTNNLGYFSPASSSGFELGDQITLDGLERVVTLLQVNFFNSSSSASSADVQVRFYRNDGVDNAPRSVLWESVINDMVFSANLSLVSFSVPRILVPDTFTWTVKLSNPSTGVFGPALFDPPTVGTSGDFIWLYDNVWEKLDLVGMVPDNGTVELVSNFGARITAVPEPATLALLGLGVACLGAMRRKKLAA